MTCHEKLEKKTGIPSQAVDTSEKLPELSKKGLVSKVRQPSLSQMENGNTFEKHIILFIYIGIQLYPDTRILNPLV